MAKLSVTAKIFMNEGQVAPKHKVFVQIYSTKTSKWVSLLRGATDNLGKLKLDLQNGPKIGPGFSPALRLVESGSPSPRILATGGSVQYIKAQDILRVDFGEIERLEETAYKRASAGISVSETVAGTPKHKVFSTLSMNRLVRIHPEIATSVTPRAAIPGRAALPERAALPSDLKVAILLNKEVQTLKARELELGSQILEKDRNMLVQAEQLVKFKTKITTLEQSLERAKGETKSAQTVADTLANTLSGASKVDTVFSTLGQKLNTANTQMEEKAIPYKVLGLKVDLRGALFNGGDTMIFHGTPTADGNTIDGNSSISGDLVPTDNQTEEVNVLVPNLMGLTQSACQRVLSSLGLRLKMATKTLKTGKGTPGQAVSQHPAATTALSHQSEVLVVFGLAPSENT